MGARDDDDGTTSWRYNVVVLVVTSLGGAATAAATTPAVCDGAAGVVLAYGFRIITIRIIILPVVL